MFFIHKGGEIEWTFAFNFENLTYPEKLLAYECGFDPFGDVRSGDIEE